ncbi:hypothetical protein EC912_102360 [Luteibacter rhizovicinus]|uniref:CVNH domain-containing protein n=1 Tax=Luteibacter rhizovicinus TaxID=242606 RepID=A0A4R3YTY6_9GAMM|nr:hypothetical protein [Luteibacter rhizovicinus]TCV96011.1 hypothetical protein EC912_102360 [Luteibacter rhizovicinus]
MLFSRLTMVPGFCAAIVLAVVSSPSVRAEQSGSASVQATALVICSTQALPAGYVVTNSDVNAACPGANVFRWNIQPASNNMSACFGSGYPAPYVITAITNSSTCAGFQGGMVLSLPTNGIAVCAPGVIWNPWVITSVALTTLQCNGYGIITIAQASEGLSICSNSPIPTGWYATGGSSSIQCQPYLVQTLHRSARLTGGGLSDAPGYIRSGDNAIFTPTGGGNP